MFNLTEKELVEYRVLLKKRYEFMKNNINKPMPKELNLSKEFVERLNIQKNQMLMQSDIKVTICI